MKLSKTYVHTQTHMQMFIAALYIIAKRVETGKLINKVLYPLNGVLLFSHKKEWSIDTCCNLHEPQIYYAELKKPVIKGHVVYDSILWNFWKRQIYETESILVVAGPGVGMGSDCQWSQASFQGDGNAVVKLDWTDGCTPLSIYWKPFSCIFKRGNSIFGYIFIIHQ